jgi:hypothetical protein
MFCTCIEETSSGKICCHSDHTKVDATLRRKLVSRGLLICRFPNVGGISPCIFLSGVRTFRNMTIHCNQYRLGKKTINWCVEAPLKVRLGGGCGTHETLAVSAVADRRRQSIPKTGSAVQRRLMQCPSAVLVRVPELLAWPRGARHPGNVYGCADIYIPRHNVEPPHRTRNLERKIIQK